MSLCVPVGAQALKMAQSIHMQYSGGRHEAHGAGAATAHRQAAPLYYGQCEPPTATCFMLYSFSLARLFFNSTKKEAPLLFFLSSNRWDASFLVLY